jgi:1-deoxy-D-xylulose-5-phosphate synthase
MNTDELYKFAEEIRAYIVEIVSAGDGHLAPNLGTVEMTLALYRIFPPDENTIIWDTGHQAYTHKILTGRAKALPSIRKLGGISGYPSIHESVYDVFGVGHAATSLAAGLGVEVAKKMNYGDEGQIIAIIGDGAMTSGIALEALNQIKTLSSKMKIILNDNGMSISPSVGQLSQSILHKLRTAKSYREIDSKLYRLFKNGLLGTFNEKVKASLKKLLLPNNFFEDFGLKYMGPIDGHDIKVMTRTFESLKAVEGPAVVHILTQKGKGIKYAEENPRKFHSVSMINPKNGISVEIKKNRYSYSEVFGRVLSMISDYVDRVIGITAAMEDGTGLNYFHSKHPEKFFDLGITEELCTTFAAGASVRGLKPVFSVYSTFLQRAFDQIVHDVSLQNLDVVFAIDRAGLVGQDGPTHHGIFDMSYLNLIPNMKILAPSSLEEFAAILKAVVGKIHGPTAIRYPRTSGLASMDDILSTRAIGDPFMWEKIMDGKDGTILAVGSMVETGKEVVNSLKERGINIALYNCRSVKPLDANVLNTLSSSPKIWTIEEGSITGGFGSSVMLKVPAELRARIDIIGIEDEFVGHGTRTELLEMVGLSSKKIMERIFYQLQINAREG